MATTRSTSSPRAFAAGSPGLNDADSDRVSSKAMDQLSKKLSEVFVQALDDNTHDAWAFLTQTLQQLPRAYVEAQEAKRSPHITHYVQRLYVKLQRHDTQADVPAVLQALRAAFPGQMDLMAGQAGGSGAGGALASTVPRLNLAGTVAVARQDAFTPKSVRFRAPSPSPPSELATRKPSSARRKSSSARGGVVATIPRLFTMNREHLREFDMPSVPAPGRSRSDSLASNRSAGSSHGDELRPQAAAGSTGPGGQASARSTTSSVHSMATPRRLHPVELNVIRTALDLPMDSSRSTGSKKSRSDDSTADAAVADTTNQDEKEVISGADAAALCLVDMLTRPGSAGAGNGNISDAMASSRPSTADSTTAEDVDEMFDNLKTGEDAVAFFAGAGRGDQVKFVYLNRASTDCYTYRPYDLVVVSRRNVEPEHFTMSAAGLVHIKPHSPTEYYSLSEWMRHSTLFNLLRSMRFYKYFVVGKAFRFWRGYVRYKRYCQTRNQLMQSLFWAKDAFCSPLVSMHRLIVELQDIKLIQVNTMHTYTHDEFLDVQTSQRKEAIKTMEGIADKLQAMLKKLCEDVIARTQLPDEITALLDAADDVVLTGLPVGMHGKRNRVKSKSMVGERKDKENRERALRIACAEADMLGKFIRLIDYIAVENLTTLAVDCCSNFLTQLQASWKYGLFQTTVSIGASEAEFSPTYHDFVSAMHTTIEETVNSTSGACRPLYMRHFKPYLVPEGQAVPRGPSEASNIRESPVFIKMKADTDLLIKTDFDRVVEYAKFFEEFRPIQEFGAAWDIQSYQEKTTYIDKFKEDMQRMRLWVADVDRIKSGSSIGLFWVDSKKLKVSLLPIPVRALEDIKLHLSAVAKQNCQAVLSKLNFHIKQMQEKPNKLREFTEYLAALNTMDEESKRLVKDAANVDRMYSQLRSYDVKITSMDDVALDDLHYACDSFQSVQEEATMYVGTKLPSMMQTLEGMISSLDDQLLGTMSELYGGIYVDPKADSTTVLSQLATAKENINVVEEQAHRFTEWQRIFKMQEYQFSNLSGTLELHSMRSSVWHAVDQWNVLLSEWKQAPFTQLDMESVEKETQAATRNAHRLGKQLTSDPVVMQLMTSLSDFKQYLPVLMDLGNRALRPRHWARIFKSLRLPYSPTASFTMQDLMNPRLLEHKAAISETSAVASGEYALETALGDIRNHWNVTTFTTMLHRDYKDVYILSSVDELQQQLEDHQISLTTMLASRYISGIRAEVEEWSVRMQLLAQVLEEWLACQKDWLYLEVVFTQGDIHRQLPSESAMFERVDHVWKEFMRKVHLSPGVLETLAQPDLLQMFSDINAVLEKVQKSLEDYLETKRQAFPRFYFLSNDELLQLLAQTRDPKAVHPHLRKCFENIAELEFGDDPRSKVITSMMSVEGETVYFRAPVFAKGNVEHWLLDVERVMQMSLFDITKECLTAYPTNRREDWLFDYPAQCILTVDQILWTNEVTTALEAAQTDPHALSQFREMFNTQLEDMVALVRGDLEPLQRALMSALTVINVHARDTLDQLLKDHVSSTLDFEWTRQLRYYWDADVDNCVVSQANSSFLYGFEYLGNTSRLVITPLTDTCYLTLTNALHMCLGGAPTGPAGTGKTETVKDLAKAMARQCVVFNCSEGVDYKIMGQLFAGLAQAGAWACFDEFNRIDIEVLSVIAQQVLTIQQALRSHVDSFVFEGRDITCNPNFGAFITMNPGYAGRTELPDNLKALFRPVSMMVPDYALIAENVLYSSGFSSARVLASKMVNLYKLSSEQLSSQDHYDFGLRGLMAVLVMAGALKRAEPSLGEDVVLIRALRDSNLPKFLADDVPLFLAIIRDLFPGTEIPEHDFKQLCDAATAELHRQGLQAPGSFVTKIVQLHQTMQVRHGVMLVGATGCGKTVLRNTLAAAVTAMSASSVASVDDAASHASLNGVTTTTLNPKSLALNELYGAFNEVSHEWVDGLIPHVVRGITGANATPGQQWIVFDGPVDALWIENMNTVLDDNKMLCLANGERIKLTDNMKMLFEVLDLSKASPATVSRCGMVYVEQADLGWQPIATAWSERLPSAVPGITAMQARLLLDMVITHGGAALKVIRQQCSLSVPTNDACLIAGLCDFVQAMLKQQLTYARTASAQAAETAAQQHRAAEEMNEDSAAPTGSQDDAEVLGMVCHRVSLTTEQVQHAFAFALIWSVGGGVTEASRPAFDAFVRQDVLASLNVTVPNQADSVYQLAVTPSCDAVVTWQQLENAASGASSWQYDASIPFFAMVVPTSDTMCNEMILNVLVRSGVNVAMTGGTGVGKTIMMQSFLRKLGQAEPGIDGKTYAHAQINVSAQTNSKDIQEIVESKLEKRRKTELAPGANKSMVYFLDDINMPNKDTYGSQPPIELLRQLIGQQGVYDRSKLFWKHVSNCQWLTASAPPGGGRSALTPRFTRHFLQLTIPSVSAGSMCRIFSNILRGHLSQPGYQESLTSVVDQVIAANVDLYTRVTEHLLPTPAKSHYTFNLRDVGKVVQGMLHVAPSNLHDPAMLVRLWAHESARVFRDRLISEEDRAWFDQAVRSAASACLPAEVVMPADSSASVFTDVMSGVEVEPVDRQYIEVSDMSAVQHRLNEALTEFSVDNNVSLDLVFFQSAVQHMLRVCRILRQPQGNAMLVGVRGCGRRSLTMLAAHMTGMTNVRLDPFAGYGLSEFREDLKRVLILSGVEGQRVVFSISDDQINNEAFLEDINNILSSGEVPNLFARDEVEQILSAVSSRNARANAAKREVDDAATAAAADKESAAAGAATDGNGNGDTKASVAPAASSATLASGPGTQSTVAGAATDASAGKRSGAGKKSESRDETWASFVQHVRNNLHIILCMSPVGDALRRRCRMFPALVNCCTIDWFDPWAEDALRNVAQHRLSHSLPSLEGTAKDQALSAAVRMHAIASEEALASERMHGRAIYITPTSYLSLIASFASLLTCKTKELDEKVSRFSTGLEKLRDTNEMVAKMQEQLTEMQPVLQEAADNTAALLEKVANDQREADEVRTVVAAEEAEVMAMTDRTKKIYDDAQADLDEAMPAYHAAVKALKSLNKNDITELKSFKNPAELVVVVMEAVCILLGVKPSWEEGKKQLTDPSFLKTLEEYDKDNIDPGALAKLRRYINNPQFQPAIVAKVSNAAKSICMWVRAIHTYARVFKSVQPKKATLAKAQQDLMEANAVLTEKRTRLAEVEDRVRQLRDQYESSLAKQAEVESSIEQTRVKLTRAEKLVTGLASEQTRWQESLNSLNESRSNVIGNMMLAAAYTAYAGPFDRDFRATLQQRWSSACAEVSLYVDGEFSLASQLVDDVRVRAWASQGLPRDALSIDNAVLVTSGTRYPLLIDPQAQANAWIKSMEAENNIVTTELTADGFVRILQAAVRSGTPLLIENVGSTLDPVLDPILLRQVVKKGGQSLVRIGDTEVEFDPNFRLYMTSKASKVQFLPEVAVKVAVINFTVVEAGLSEQMLAQVVRIERPDLEEERGKLVSGISDGQAQLSELEGNILSLLVNATGSILDDEVLINTLAASKKTSSEVTEWMEKAKKTAGEIEHARASYIPVAARGALLYFAVVDMAKVDAMYAFSLDFIMDLFVTTIERTQAVSDVAKRVALLVDRVTDAVFDTVCRGLFNKHRLLFSLVIATHVLRRTGHVSDEEWSVFLRDAAPASTAEDSTLNAALPAALAGTLSEEQWSQVIAVAQTVPSLEGLPASMETVPEQWAEWLTSANAADSDLPPPLHLASPFQRLVVLKILRHECVMAGARALVADTLGERYIQGTPFNLRGAYGESTPWTPIIFVLSSGVDPTGFLIDFAEIMDMKTRLRMVSLGQGQGPIAEHLINQASSSGGWVCLQNCHLAASWLPRLTVLLDQLSSRRDQVHPEFRLWLTSMPTPAFPERVLHNGIKLTKEPPHGLQASLAGTYATLSDADMSACDDDDMGMQLRRLTFALAVFKAVLEERREYGAIGFNTAYPWNASDFKVSLEMLQMALRESDSPDDSGVPFTALRTMIGRVNYGGRVTDMWDQRCVSSLLKQHLSPAVLTEGHAFDTAGDLPAPTGDSIESYRAAIDALPKQTLPGVLGLHANAAIALQRQQAATLLSTLLSLQPRTGADVGPSPSALVIGVIKDISAQLPALLDVKEAHAKTFEMLPDGTPSCLGTFLSQEIVKFNRLLTVLRQTLQQLERGLRGLDVMSSDLEALFDALLNNRVPAAWEAVAYNSTRSLRPWVADLVRRVEFLRSWLRDGPPTMFWLGGFFFPQGFITSVLQMHARKTRVPVNTLALRTTVMTQDVALAPENGVYVRGLYLEGAKWNPDEEEIQDSEAGELYDEMPPIWLNPVDASLGEPSDVYNCPVYKTPVRSGVLSTTGLSTNFILSLNLPTSRRSDHFVRRGVAMLCELPT